MHVGRRRREPEQQQQPPDPVDELPELDLHERAAVRPAAGEAAGATPRHLPEPGSRRAAHRDVGPGVESVQVRVHHRRRLPVHRVRQGGRAEDVQEQVQLPASRVPVPRGPPEEGVPVSRLPEGVLEAGQDEEPHEDGARLLHAEGRRVPAHGILPAALNCLIYRGFCT